jgi:hypothetical protein
MGIFDLFGRGKKQDPDASVLLQLRKAGSNLSKPHEVEFFLYFPTQSIAEQAAAQIRDAGFKIEVRPGAKSDDWLCFTTKTIVPDLLTFQKIRTEFESLSKSLGGEYDGWGTPLVQ